MEKTEPKSEAFVYVSNKELLGGEADDKINIKIGNRELASESVFCARCPTYIRESG